MLPSRLKPYKSCTQLLPVLCHRSTSLNKKFPEDFHSEAPTMVAVNGNTFLEIYSVRGTFHFNKCTVGWGVCDGWTQAACADSLPNSCRALQNGWFEGLKCVILPFVTQLDSSAKKIPHLALGNHLFLWWSVWMGGLMGKRRRWGNRSVSWKGLLKKGFLISTPVVDQERGESHQQHFLNNWNQHF